MPGDFVLNPVSHSAFSGRETLAPLFPRLAHMQVTVPKETITGTLLCFTCRFFTPKPFVLTVNNLLQLDT